MEDINDLKLRERLINHIKGGEAFTPVEQILNKIPFEKLGEKPYGLPYSFYQQFYHLKYAQLDILEFSKNNYYHPPSWPDDYWPENPAPGDQDEWNKLVDDYFRERSEFCDIISDTHIDLFEPFPHGSGQNLLREALLVVEHAAYHTGQLMIILRLLDCY